MTLFHTSYNSNMLSLSCLH